MSVVLLTLFAYLVRLFFVHPHEVLMESTAAPSWEPTDKELEEIKKTLVPLVQDSKSLAVSASGKAREYRCTTRQLIELVLRISRENKAKDVETK